MEDIFETDALYGLSHDTLIPYHEWSREIGFSSHKERNYISFWSLDGLVVEYWGLECDVVCSFVHFPDQALEKNKRINNT